MKKWFIGVFLLALTLSHSVPITYQGKLTDFWDLGVNDTAKVLLEIYDEPLGGTLVDADTVYNVIIEKGLFSAIFDLSTPISPLDDSLYYQVSIDIGSGFARLSPRQLITSNFATMWSEQCEEATWAQQAQFANQSNIASHAFYADSAGMVAGTAPDSVTYAIYSDTASFTIYSDSSNYVDTSGHSLFADSSGAVTWEMISNYFRVINDTAFHEVRVSDTLRYFTFTYDTLLSFEKINSGGQTGLQIQEYGHPSTPILFAIYDDNGFTFWAGETLLVISSTEITNGYAILANDDTVLSFTVEDDADGIAFKVDEDTLYYLNYDSLLIELVGTDDIWGALSDTMDNRLDTLMAELSDSLDAFRGELSDSLNSRFIAGVGTITTGNPSVVINEPEVSATSIITITMDCTGGTNPGFTVPLAILNITDGVSFTVGTADGSNAPANISFYYIIFKP
ncbi:hypothetical protein DRQ33_03045 [bacterium]|nr:MAG: hypothetical protein DRQ33_03045 [bacterium]